MRSREENPVRRSAWIGAAVAVAVVVGTVLGVHGLASAQQQNRATTFSGQVGLIQNTIKGGATADFEMVMQKVKEALRDSQNPVRQRQGRSWRTFKSSAPGPQGVVFYFHVLDPPVPDGDYTISTILAEGFPAEAQQLYDTFSNAFQGGVVPIDLQLVNDFSR